MGEPIAEVGRLAGICGHDVSAWEKILIDSSKRLVVAVADSGGSDLQDVVDAINSLINVVVYRATGVVVHNVTMTNADTEYSQELTEWTKKFTIKCRGEYDMKLAFANGESGSNYITIPSGQCYWDDNVRHPSLTLYFQCATAAQVAEIVRWL